MQIIPATETDLPAVTDIFKEAFKEDARMYPTDKPANMFVAHSEGKVVGAGRLFRSFLHGTVPTVAIAVAPEARRRGVGNSIFNAILESKLEIPIGIDGCCFDHDKTAIAFMESFGFKPYLDCYIPQIDLAIEAPKMSTDVFDIKTLSEAYAEGLKASAVTKFLADKYDRSHQWSPVTISTDDPVWEKIALAGVDPELSTVLIKDGIVTGASTGWAEEDVLEMGWTFATASSFETEVRILKSLMAMQFKLALNRNVNIATMECDSTDPGMPEAVKGMETISSEVWKRFRFKNS